jgi:ring-1,2-phenylacetyl-CoA epoxidase subunit PaaD
MSEVTKSKLKTYGIAPPQAHTKQRIGALISDAPTDVACPQCNSVNTKLISEFGSTACKSLMKCNDCLETFDYFKCI